MQLISALFIPIFFITQTHFVFGASFDCTKALTITEKAICNNAEISSLDEQLGKLYSLSRKTVFSQDGEEQKNIINNIKSLQKEWIFGAQQGCNADVSCLRKVYIDRIGEFKQLLGISSADQQSEETEEKNRIARMQETREKQNKELERLQVEKLSQKQWEKDKKKVENKVNIYQQESENLKGDIKNFILENDDFDVLKIGELFLDLEKSIKLYGWKNKTIEAYENLRNYVFSSDNFKNFYEKQIENRSEKYLSDLESAKERLSEKLVKIKDFVLKNLGSDKTKGAMELANSVKEQIKSNDLDSLRKLNDKIDKWFKRDTPEEKIKVVEKKQKEKKQTKNTKIRTNESKDFIQEKKDLIGFYQILRRIEMCQKTEIISYGKLNNSQKLVKSFEIFLKKKYEDVNFSKIRRDAIRIENKKMGELYKTMEFTYSMGANLRNSEMMGFCNLAYTALQGMKNEYNF